MTYRAYLLLPAFCAAAALGHAETPLEQGYRQMYNLQFAQAHETFHEWQSAHPQDPMGPVSAAAAYLFAEFDRLHILQAEFFVHDQHFVTDHKLTPDPAVKGKFDAALAAAEQLAARTPKEANAQFAAVLAKGLRSNYMALVEKRYAAALSEMKAGRLMAERLLSSDPNLYDAWLAVGVENYMLSVKPVVVRWFLRLGGAQTGKEKGIEKLKLTAEKGHYLAPFARMLLAVAAMRDHDEKRAHELLSGLAQEFPKNPLYAQELSRLNPLAESVPR
jgi:hypothetical protein